MHIEADDDYTQGWALWYMSTHPDTDDQRGNVLLHEPSFAEPSDVYEQLQPQCGWLIVAAVIFGVTAIAASALSPKINLHLHMRSPGVFNYKSKGGEGGSVL